MTFSQIPAGDSIFIDANTLIYHFANDPKFGKSCTQLVKRVEQQDISAFTSTHALADVAHRLMTLEAIDILGWPAKGIASRLRKQHSELPKLKIYQQAISSIPLLAVQVFPLSQNLVESATQLSRQWELLTGDALVVAVMQANGLTSLASNDADFDRVPGITRYGPV